MNSCGDCKYFDLVQARIGSCENVKCPDLECHALDTACGFFESKEVKSMESEVWECPICKRKVLWDNMVWLNGQCTCPECYMQKRAAEDLKRKENKQ